MPELGGLMTFLTKNLNQKSFVLNLQAKKTLKVLKLKVSIKSFSLFSQNLMDEN